MNHQPVDIPAIAGQISDRIFTCPYTAGKQLNGLQSVRWLGRQQKLIVHKEGFQADGTNQHIALFCIGFPDELQQPFNHMIVRQTNAARQVDPNKHDLLNFTLLQTWLPEASYSIYVLPYTTSLNKLSVARQDLMAALEDCRVNTYRGRPVDYIISSIFPGDATGILQDETLFINKAGRPIISFWPTGNFKGQGQRQLDFSVADSVLLSGQVDQWSKGTDMPVFEMRDDVRYNEMGLPHFWAPNPSPGHPLSSGSSYSTVPAAMVWIKIKQMLDFLAGPGLVIEQILDAPAYLQSFIKMGRTFQDRISRPSDMACLDHHLGLVNLPRTLEYLLKAQDTLTPETCHHILDVFSQPAHPSQTHYDTYTSPHRHSDPQLFSACSSTN